MSSREKEDYDKGWADGYEHGKYIKEHPLDAALNPFTSKPYETDNEPYNRGVEKGMEDSKKD